MCRDKPTPIFKFCKKKNVNLREIKVRLKGNQFRKINDRNIRTFSSIERWDSFSKLNRTAFYDDNLTVGSLVFFLGQKKSRWERQYCNGGEFTESMMFPKIFFHFFSNFKNRLERTTCGNKTTPIDCWNWFALQTTIGVEFGDTFPSTNSLYSRVLPPIALIKNHNQLLFRFPFFRWVMW